MAGEVTDEVNSLLAVPTGSSGATVAASCQVSKEREANKTLAVAVQTTKGFLTGQDAFCEVLKKVSILRMNRRHKQDDPGAKRKQLFGRGFFFSVSPTRLFKYFCSVNQQTGLSFSTTFSCSILKAGLRSTSLKTADFVLDENRGHQTYCLTAVSACLWKSKAVVVVRNVKAKKSNIFWCSWTVDI